MPTNLGGSSAHIHNGTLTEQAPRLNAVKTHDHRLVQFVMDQPLENGCMMDIHPISHVGTIVAEHKFLE